VSAVVRRIRRWRGLRGRWAGRTLGPRGKEACGEVGVKESVPHLRENCTRPGTDLETVRCSLWSLALLEGVKAVPLIAPHAASPVHRLRTAAESALQTITRADYEKDSARFQDWRDWWTRKGAATYGVAPSPR